MIKVYCYGRCTTCKKALKWLMDNHINYELIDIKEQNPNADVIKNAWKTSGQPLKKFFNTSGKIYREMELTKKLPDMSDDEKIALLSSDGMLVKRPLLIADDFVLLGFKETEWSEKLK